MSTGAGPGAGGRNLWLSVSGVFFFLRGVLRFLPQKNTVFRLRKKPKTMVFEPRPQCSPKPVRGGLKSLVVGADGMKKIGRWFGHFMTKKYRF